MSANNTSQISARQVTAENTATDLKPPELFVLRDDEGPILYAPLGRLMARGNELAVETALAYAHDHTAYDSMGPEEQAVVRALTERGFYKDRA